MDGTGEEPAPRRLPENYVEYMLVIVDSDIERRDMLSHLENVRKTAAQLCNTLTKDYIWQRDSFQLHVKRGHSLLYLHGTADYGDSVEDEWLIVYILRQLTTIFTSLWVRVFDGDGEFLLVEAANVLPAWLSPEIDGNRTWIHQSRLYLLPLSASSGVKRHLSLQEAVTCITSEPATLIQSPLVEAEAFYRLEKYPDNIKASIHRSLLTIPRKLAHILHVQPAAIAPAIEAFYLRDPVALTPLMRSSSDLHFPPSDLVDVSVTFTKVLFAQVKFQHFPPPPSWASLFPSEEERSLQSDQKQQHFHRLELGMKVSSGFEMLAANTGKKDNRLAREFAVLLEDVEEDGDRVLPSNEVIASWSEVTQEDSDAWLDIDFDDFNNELKGRRGHGKTNGKGFGDEGTQADLRKIVSRFESFLNDETAGIDGAELDDMDQDDDDEDDEDDEDDSEEEDTAVTFDEDRFNAVMREMMGLPAETTDQGRNMVEREDDASDDEEEDVTQLAAQMEAELKELGALKVAGKIREADNEGEQGDGNGDEVDIDYNLARNILESFKSQEGTAGPAGNLLGMMGIRLPRDEEEAEEDEEKEDKVGKKN
ncbi:SGT1-domain-containing protein [Xylariaceae sp. FL0255]|nr:SGT1-domain-containing protein [Xylariaceae sp. FL0255]